MLKNVIVLPISLDVKVIINVSQVINLIYVKLSTLKLAMIHYSQPNVQMDNAELP
jgi:hypothetical protein